MENKNYKDDMNKAFQGDPNEFMNSLKDEEYKKYIHKKYELIVQFFQKIDTNKDGMLSYNELVSFLDQNMSNGKKFDKESADKIMKLLDTDHNGLISLAEFSKTFIQIEEELKMHLQQTRSKLGQEESAFKNYQSLAHTYKNENITNGLSDSARLKIEINTVTLSKFNKKNSNIYVKIVYGKDEKLTSLQKDIRNLVWNESFEFKVNNLNDVLRFDICLGDGNREKEEIIGSVRCPIDRVENQEEYEVEIIVPDDRNPDNPKAKIGAKMQFIKSFYQYYQDLMLKTEGNKKNLEVLIKESQKLFENLNEPFKFFSQLDSSDEFKKFNAINYGAAGNTSTYNYSERSRSEVYQFQVADKLESFIKEKLNKPNLPWMPIIRLLIFAIFLGSFINLLSSCDFVTIIILTYITLIFYTTFNQNQLYNLTIFMTLSLINIGLDILSFFMLGKVTYDGGAESTIRGFVSLISFCSFIAKVLLALIFWMNKLKAQKGENEPLNTSQQQLNI